AEAASTWRPCKLKFSHFTDPQLAALVNLSRDQVEMYAEHRDVISRLKKQHKAFSPIQLIDFLKETAETGGQSIRNRLAQLYLNYNVPQSTIWFTQDD